MTRDDIIRMAREAGFNTDHDLICIEGWEISPYMQRFAELVAAHEREAAAKDCETLLPSKRIFDQRYYDAVGECVATIRARGEK